MPGRMRAAIANEADAVLAAVLERAKLGDVQAARVLLDRICPPLKAEALPVEVAGLSAGTLSERALATLEAAGRGDVSPDVAASLMAAVGTLARVREVDELERRIAALENRKPTP